MFLKNASLHMFLEIAYLRAAKEAFALLHVVSALWCVRRERS